MKKTFLAALLALLALPAYAKSNHDVFPVSCDLLWTAVKDTLGNENDYSVVAIDEAGKKASFVVIGETTPYKNVIALVPKDDACAMKLTVLQVGPDNSDERGFRKRLGKSLARLQAAKEAKPTVPQAQP